MPAKFCPRHQRWPSCPLLWSYLGLFLSISLSAQTADLAYRNYTIDDGLPSSECYEIIQDNKGYIWISSDNGVSRFDGYQFKNYGTEEGLLDKTVLFMHEDYRGWIWMSTLSGNIYIHRGDTIAAYDYNHLLQANRDKYTLIHDFIIDSAGTLHLSLQLNSILSIDVNGNADNWRIGKKKQEYGAYIREGKLLQLTERNQSISDEYGNIKPININDPLFPKQGPVVVENGKTRISSKLFCFMFKIGEQLLILNYDNLYLFDQNYQLISRTSFNKGGICSLELLKDGRLLIGLLEGNGLLVYSSVSALFNEEPPQHYFSGKTISHLKEDNNGSIWLTTTESGVYYIPSLSVKNYSFSYDDIQLAAATTNNKNELFLGTTNGRIFKIIEEQIVSELPLAVPIYRIEHLKYLNDLELLFINSPVKFYKNNRWNNVNNSFSPITKNFILTGYIEDITDENTIKSFNSSGTFYLEPVEKGYHFSLLKNSDFSSVTCVAKTHPDTTWLGTRSGLFLWDQENDTKIPVKFSSLLDVNIRCLKIYNDRSLLIGTKNNGMLRLKNKELTQISKEDGLIDNTVDRIKVDKFGHIWITSKKGLNRLVYSDSTFQITTITTLNGLPSNEVVDISFCGNSFWVIGKKTATVFPDSFRFKRQTLNVFIDNIIVDGLAHPLDSDIQVNWNSTVQFSFTSFHYQAYTHQTFRYRLNQTNDWISTNQPMISFTNLKPNDYQLEIQALQNDQSWSSSTQLSIRVSPPYWQQWWFQLLFFLIIGYSFYYLFNLRINKLKQERKQLELEEQVNQFKQKAYQAQMNPHFVFNCLNAIQGYIIGGKNDQKQAARFLVRFSDLMRQALDSSRKESVSLNEEVRLLDNYLSLEQMRFNQKFDYSINIDAALEKDSVQIPPMLVQSYVENAVIHGVANLKYRGKIDLSYKMKGEMLEVRIRDNGPGINYTKALKKEQPGTLVRESLGMKIAEQRLDILSGGANNIQLNELRNKKGEINGTEIVITIKSQL